ncbi:MAG: hypothetical protein ABI547_05970, partial [Betaproteobacteria bacterium]
MMRASAVSIAVALAISGAAQAADYPERAVRVIVTFPAGGGTDIVARMIFQKIAFVFRRINARFPRLRCHRFVLNR